MRGPFITLEGGEGTGKSTQARLLVARLRQAGHPVLATREPGGSPGAEAIREVLLSGATDGLGPTAQALLVTSARADHMEKTIRPALDAGTWVVCDRFIDSTRVYQGLVGGLDRRWVRLLERLVVGRDRPDVTFVLDLPADVAQARVRARDRLDLDRFERKDVTFYDRLREGFHTVVAQEPERCRMIDASRPPDIIAATIWRLLGERLAGAAGQGPSQGAAC